MFFPAPFSGTWASPVAGSERSKPHRYFRLRDRAATGSTTVVKSPKPLLGVRQDQREYLPDFYPLFLLCIAQACLSRADRHALSLEPLP